MSFTKERLVLDLPLTERPWNIGHTSPTNGFDGKWWTNQALANVSGSLSNDRLMRMTDEELKALAYGPSGYPTTERYRRPSTKPEADRQGGFPSEEYLGTHRAYIILQFRAAQALDKRN